MGGGGRRSSQSTGAKVHKEVKMQMCRCRFAGEQVSRCRSAGRHVQKCRGVGAGVQEAKVHAGGGVQVSR